MHLKRWLTAIIAIPLLILLISFSPRWVFYPCLLLFSLTGLNEYYRLTLPNLSLFLKYFIYVFVSLLFFILYKQVLVAVGLFSLVVIASMIFYLFADPLKGEQYLSEVGKIVLGVLYVCLPLAMLMQIDSRLYYLQHSVRGIWIYFLLVITFANDTGAYYSGKLFGKHKLYKTVSPKKTWEGSVGGLLLACIAAVAFLKIFRLHPVDYSIVLLIILLSVAGQVGDLAESMLKRNYNVKDSGELLPGHGGVLDRIDSLLFAAPILYIYLTMTI